MPIRTMLALIAVAGTAAAARTGDDSYGAGACMSARAPESRQALGFDADTGKNTRRYPPDRVVDFRHMKLAIDIPDMNVPRARAVQTLTLSPVGKPVANLTLDAKLLQIEKVEAAGRSVKFTSDARALNLEFDPPLEAGSTTELVTTYTISDPPQGLQWTPESPAWPGRAAQIHTQGESDTNSYWFPCHDFPNEKLTTELLVAVPAGFVVSSNGRETGHTTEKGREVWHFVQDKPHVNYLVSLVVGKFDVVDVSKGKGAVPMPVYVPPGRGRDVAATYGKTPEMVELFGRLVNQPYAWDKYAQVVVWNFGAGGMENTSATTMYDTAILSRDALDDGDLEGLISHELAHQWFGDLITCNSWEHIWINEGFATYFSQLWFEHSRGRDAYLAGILGNFDSVRHGDHADAPFQAPMCRKTYNEPGEAFGGPANPYPKGSSILHMLRSKLGDEMFFRGLSLFVERYRFKTAETADLRRCMEEVSGESLERFFTQWCFRPGMPDLNISLDWDAAASELVVSVVQTQNIDGDNPAFDFDLPISISDDLPAESTTKRERGQVKREARPQAGDAATRTIAVHGQKTTQRVKLDREPAIVAVDPELHVLSRPTIHQPLKRWLAQLDRGPSLPAKIQAARELGSSGGKPGAMALATIATDERQPEQLRSEALHALADLQQADALSQIASGTVQPSDVRVALVEAVATLAPKLPESAAKNTLKAILVDHAGSDTSFRARAEALRGLGKLKATDQVKLVLTAAETPSQHDRVRQGALDALADMDAPDTLAAAVRFAMPGSLNRTRPVAINAVAALAHQNPESAYRSLVMLLSDRERRAWQAAGDALVKLGDQRAVDEFEKLAALKPDAADQKRLRDWAAELKSKAAAAEAKPTPKG